MDIRIFETAQEASKAGAKLIADVIKSQSATVLGLATGSTPVGMYQEWARMNAAGELSFETVSSYNLDEYIGLDGTHDQSYRYFMDKNLFDHINIDKAHTHVPCGTGADHAADAKHYDEMIKAEGGIERIVWMPKELKDDVAPRLNKTAKELYGIDNFADMIADETICTDCDALMSFLQEKNHPVLAMEPLM